MVRALCYALLLFTLVPALAIAKPETKSGGGKAEFEKAMRFYQAQEYDAALPWFEKAYELSGRRASTIRALAQCERSLKMYEAAVRHFKEYLATQPTPSDADSVSETVRLLEEIVAERAREASPQTTPAKPTPNTKPELALVPAETAPPPPPPKTEPALVAETTAPAPSSGPGPYLLMAGGGASLVAGTILLALGASAASTVENAAPGTPFNDVRGDADSAPVLSGVGIGLIGVGAIALGGGVVWLVSE